MQVTRMVIVKIENKNEFRLFGLCEGVQQLLAKSNNLRHLETLAEDVQEGYAKVHNNRITYDLRT